MLAQCWGRRIDSRGHTIKLGTDPDQLQILRAKRWVCSRPRSASCGCASASGTDQTGPAGTPCAVSFSTHSRVGAVAKAASSSAVRADRLASRFFRSAKRGSCTKTGLPMISQSASNCSCLLAAMFITPSAVLNVPDGLAVKLSLPFGVGAFPAIRWFDTTQPIVAMTASASRRQ